MVAQREKFGGVATLIESLPPGSTGEVIELICEDEFKVCAER